MCIFKNLCATILISTLSFGAAAQPKISSVEGGLQLGEEIRVQGTGFGTPNFNILMRDTADNHVVLEGLANPVSFNHSELWGTQGSNWAEPLYVTTESQFARGSDKTAYKGVKKAYMGWPEPLSGKSNERLFVSWWFKPLKDPGAAGGSNKFLRVWDRADGDHTRMAWDQMHIVYWRKDVDSSGYIQWGNWDGVAGQWNKVDAWMDSISNQMIIHVNGKKVIDVSDFKKSNVSSGLTVALIGFDPSFPDKYPDMVFGIDDIYISDTQARVEISNSSTWTQGMLREIQTPKMWTDQEIAFDLSTSLFDLSEPLYLYVVSENGEVNSSGYAVSSKAPSKIETLQVQ